MTDAPTAGKSPERWPRIRRLAKTAAAIVAAVGVVFAGIGYITQGVRFFTQITDYFEDRSELRNQVPFADERLARADYQAAWDANAKARALAPRDAGLAAQQSRIAMTWLENASISSAGGPKNFAELVEPLKAALLARLPAAQGTEKADILAHIGWANFLRTRDGLTPNDIAEEFDAALAQDPDNTYGHAMRGFWLLWNTGPVDKARPDFDWALRNSRDPEYSDGLIMAALTNKTSDEFMLGAMEYADAIRKSGRDIDASAHARLAWYYTIALHDKDLLAKIAMTIPASGQGPFLDWLRKGEMGAHEKRALTYFTAYFAEQDSRKDDALKLYGDLAADSSGGNDDVATLAKDAAARLRKR